MAPEEGINSICDIAQRRGGRDPYGKLARFGRGDTDHWRFPRPVYLEKGRKWKKWRKKPNGGKNQKGVMKKGE